MDLLTPGVIEPEMESLLFLSICICIRTGNTDCGRFKKAAFIVVNRRRAEMQRAGHPVTEVTNLALACCRCVITDMTGPGRSFHFVAATHSILFNSAVCEIQDKAYQPRLRHYAHCSTQKQADDMEFLDPQREEGMILHSQHFF